MSEPAQEVSLPKPPEKVWFLLHADGHWYGPYTRTEGDEDAGDWQAYVPEDESLQETAQLRERIEWCEQLEAANKELKMWRAHILELLIVMGTHRLEHNDSFMLAAHDLMHCATSSDIAIGAWLTAALDDPEVCDAMKTDIRNWMESKTFPTRQDQEASQ